MSPGNYSAIVCNYGSLTVNNSLFNKGDFLKGCLFVNRADFIVENTTFANMSSSFATAINYKGWNITIRNSKFINLHSRLTGGASI